MRTASPFARFAALSLIAACGLAATAQPETNDPQPVPEAQPQPPRKPQLPRGGQPRANPPAPGPNAPNADPFAKPERRFSLEFPGGTAEEYVKLIRNAAPEANVVLATDAATFELGRVSLRDITLGDAMSALTMATWSGTWNGSGEAPEIRFQETDNKIYLVRTRARGQAGHDSSPTNAAETVSVFPIAENAKGGPQPDVVLTAIQAGLQMLPSESPANISFHKESGLLFVKGSGKHLRIVMDILNGFNSVARQERNDNATSAYASLLDLLGVKDAAGAAEMMKSFAAERQMFVAKLDDSERQKARAEAQAQFHLEAIQETRVMASKLQEELRRMRDVNVDLQARIDDLQRRLSQQQNTPSNNPSDQAKPK